MKVLGIVSVLVLLTACAGRPTLGELEDQAVATGDWTLVHRREAMLDRRREKRGVACPSEYVRYCWDHMAEERCSCVSPQGLGRIY